MNLPKTTSLLALALSTVLVSCEAVQSGMGAMTAGGGGSSMVDTMKDTPTTFLVQMAPNPSVGQWWEHSMAGGAVKQKYAVVAEMDGQFVVEMVQDMGGTMIVDAWLVDPSVDVTRVPAAGEKMTSNVTKAWIGEEGGKPMERPVMDAPVIPEATGDAPEVAFTEGTESVSMAGKSWNSKWMETADSKTWMVDGTNFMLKSMAGGSVSMELTGYGTDAETSLDWTE